MIDNGANRRRTPNTRLRAKRADHSTTSIRALETLFKFSKTKLPQLVYSERFDFV